VSLQRNNNADEIKIAFWGHVPLVWNWSK